MYVFTKTVDENFADVDQMNVKLWVDHNEVDITQLTEMFEDFLKACGFQLPKNEHFQLVSDEDLDEN